uniref:Chemokine interleukin-8-like domain-containing protein n=1 Tax=Pundamilia nyererei TaxID=303518 RepID=A0A3B4FT66_9CICH
MSLKILSIALLLLSSCCHSSARPGSKSPCCAVVTSVDMSPEVVGQTYSEQAARGPCVKAIIFNTEFGALCADPDARWVKDLTAKMMKV